MGNRIGNPRKVGGIASWIPYYGTGVKASDAYTFRSAMCPHLTACYDLRRTDLPYDEIRRRVAEWIEVRDLLFGDYYPLTPWSARGDVWMAWQFHRPEEGRGMVQAFRRAGSAERSRTLRLRGLDPSVTYVIRDLDAPEREDRHTGRELAGRGLPLAIGDAPGTALVTYRRDRDP